MKSVFFFVFGLVSISNAIGQNKLTNEEILKYWVESEKPFTRDSLINTRFDDDLDIRINKLIDSLKAKNIDSIVVFSSAYPGYNSNNKCYNGVFPIDTYIIWKLDGETNYQKFKGRCNFEVVRLNSNDIFDFYESNYLQLNSEFFMPIILEGKIDKKRRVSYSTVSIDHEPNYCIYYFIRNNFRTLRFTESEIKDKRNLFIEHNVSHGRSRSRKVM